MRIPIALLALTLFLVPVSSAREAVTTSDLGEHLAALSCDANACDEDAPTVDARDAPDLPLDGGHRVIWGPCHRHIRGPDVPTLPLPRSDVVSIIKDQLPC